MRRRLLCDLLTYAGELKASQVAVYVRTESRGLADRMVLLGAQRKEKELRLYQETMDIPTLLKMRAG